MKNLKVLFVVLFVALFMHDVLAVSVSNYYKDKNEVTFLAWVYTARRDVAGCIVPDDYKGVVVIPNEVDGHDVDWINGYPDREEDPFSISSTRAIDLVLPSGSKIGTPYWVDKGLFEGCEKLASVTIPADFSLMNDNMNNGMDYAYTLNNGMFKNCTSLTNVIASQMTYKYLVTNMFFGCTVLKTATFSSAIESIGANAFKGCNNLSSVTFTGVKPVGMDQCGIRDACWINISKSNYSSWKDCGCRLVVTQTSLDPFAAIRLREAVIDRLEGVTTIISEVDDATILKITKGALKPITRQESTVLYISDGGAPYTVKFNANGGSGTMANQSFAYGEAKNLTANAFTRTGYTFQGWATSASGAKVYSDKQSVSNLTKESNATVNLYAVWEKVQSEFSDSDITINGYSGKYDGIAHGVVATSEISGFEVKYCVTKDGPFEVASPTIKNVGSMMVWCELSAPGYVTTTNSATVTISPREVTLTSASASKVYDGLPLQNTSVTIGGEGFVSGEGATYNVTGSQTSVGSSENSFTYTLQNGTKAENYTITTQAGLLTVTAASIGGGAFGSEEPGGGIVPQGGLSKFDTSVMYDGKAHTIDTNALLAVTLAGTAPEFSYALAEAGPWQSMPFVYTNVCTTSFWYKISAENYQDYIHEARVTITKRPIAITSGNGTWVYDGLPHSNTAVTIDGLVDGDGVETKNFATITEVGSEANSFDYEFSDGTLALNYAVTCVTGQLSVVAANMDDWVDDSKWSVTLAGNNTKYDGAEKVCAVSALSYDGIAIPAFSITGNTATDAGSYTLTVTGTGNYSGTHAFEWSILPREVTLTSASASKVYDGIALVNNNVIVGGDGFVEGEGVNFEVAGSQTSVGSSENTFAYTFKDGTKAKNYTVATQTGLLTVTAASIGGGSSGGEEPGNGVVSQGGLSKFDTTVMYDGKAHTIDTNALFAVTLAGSAPEFSYALAETGPWQSMPFVYTNVCTTSLWYKISADNYQDYIHEARVTITNRPITITSGNGTWGYDGLPHSNTAVTIDGLVDGDTVETKNFAIITEVGTVVNSFVYEFLDGTLASNYAVTCVTGQLSVVAANIDDWVDASKWSVTLAGNNTKYDGAEKVCAVSALSYDGIAIPTFAVTGNTATDAGSYTLSVTGTGNYSGTHAFEWSILPREVTLTSGSASKVYDGTALVNGDVAISGDGFVSGEGANFAITGSQTSVGSSENTFAYTFKDGTKAENYTVATQTGLLTVIAASIGGGASGGEEPGSGSVPAGGVSKFDASFEYDGEGHTVDAAAILAAYETAVIGGVAECKYALSATSDAWQDMPPSFTNVCVTSVWYKVSAANYEDFVHEVRLTINPRDIANVTIEPIDDVTFENNPVTPTPIVTDGVPSIIAADDYTVSYFNNTAPGTATVVLTGKVNYTGEKTINFTIKEAVIPYAALKGELVWKLNMGSGCYTAQLKLVCTNGFKQGVSDLKFIYQDRMNGTKITSGLWDSASKAYRSTTLIDGTTYRYVSLDASMITAQDVTAIYGVEDVSVAVGVVPAAQCTIELFVGNLASPISDLGYVMWKSNGSQCMLPISAAGGSQGMEVSPAMLNTMRMVSKASALASPLSTSALNTSLALGIVLDSASNPYCRMTNFSVTENGLTGRVEVGKAADGIETKGSLGVNARVVLMGAKDLSEGFSEIGNVLVDESGIFTFHLDSKDYRFFKVRVDIQNVVE